MTWLRGSGLGFWGLLVGLLGLRVKGSGIIIITIMMNNGATAGCVCFLMMRER